MKQKNNKPYPQRLREYEQAKRELFSKQLTGQEFEREVKRLAEKYKV